MTTPADPLLVLLDRACRGVATPAEAEQLRAAVTQLRRTTGGLQAKVQQQAAQLARAEQQAAAAEPAGEDWPDHDPRRHMLRHGRWKPIDDLNDIDRYQPQEAA